MSLRLRLILLLTALMGGVLLIFGALVYGLVGVVMLSQTDDLLQRQSAMMARTLQVDLEGRFTRPSLTALDEFDRAVYVQVWGTDRTLYYSRPHTQLLALDEGGLLAGQTVFRDVNDKDLPLRVLSTPLITHRGTVGTLQVGASLNLLRTTQRTLALVIGILTLAAMLATGGATSLVIRRALNPLESITRVAEQITRADDLSRRIPFQGNGRDEVGTLVRVINETLARLEDLFHTQKRFVADVSHELRTPLTVIRGEVSLLRRMKTLDEESLGAIEGEVDRLTRMVGNLLLLAQAESGKLALDIRPVELDSLLMEVFQQVRTLAGDRLRVQVEGIVPVVVECDRDRIKQVLLNLAGNAVEYTPAGGVVSLTLAVEQDVRIIIRDTGAGIPDEDLPHIFERFYRAEKSRKRSAAGGFGLGLSISYWIVRNHGGSIEVASKVGVGTSFTVRLPITQPVEVNLAGNEKRPG